MEEDPVEELRPEAASEEAAVAAAKQAAKGKPVSAAHAEEVSDALEDWLLQVDHTSLVRLLWLIWLTWLIWLPNMRIGCCRWSSLPSRDTASGTASPTSSCLPSSTVWHL